MNTQGSEIENILGKTESPLKAWKLEEPRTSWLVTGGSNITFDNRTFSN
jgi:hypothetical protein